MAAVNNFIIDSLHHIPQKNETDLATITEIVEIMEDRLSHLITSNILENI